MSSRAGPNTKIPVALPARAIARSGEHGRLQARSVTIAASLLLAGVARAQIAQDQTLVVYDSRIADSLATAEFYAGSKKVSGGSGSEPGVRPAVRVVNLATLGAPTPPTGNISAADFVTRLRTPLRVYLTNNNLATRVRCLVTTKGLPHRVQDSDVPNAGDFPGDGVGQFLPELTGNDATCASVDTELTLLWQDLTTGEVGGTNDSKSDGVIVNPYARSNKPFITQANNFITSPKSFSANGLGPTWTLSGTLGTAGRLNPGDIYVVSRLDGRTLADVRAMVGRAQNLLINTSTAAVLLDEDGANLDNSGSAFPTLNAGNDYELTQTLLNNDRRFPPSQVRYNNALGAAQFFVGPNLAFAPGQGLLVTDPVILLATYGSNHNGVPQLAAGGSSGTVYASSFNYAPGCVFNTIESYNGRDFGGLGPWFIAQQQAADFLQAGGTFAVCNVWEPLADSIPDNIYITQNFLLGNMCWAEAAWTGIPGLSWMQMAVGDPLARATRTNEDIDANARVGLDDLYSWEQLPGTASVKDINRSGTADGIDRALLAGSARASERVLLTAGR